VRATGGNDDVMAIGREDELPQPLGPLRRCIATGEIRSRSILLRFVVDPRGELVPDAACNLPGRGLWLTPRRDIFERAVAKRLFSRAARRQVSIAPGLAGRIETVLVQRCCDEIGLARRAGLAVAGFEKVSDAIRAGKVALLLAALDGSAGGRGKLLALAPHMPLAAVLTAVEMGTVFGRDSAVNVGLGAGRLCRRLIADAEKLAGFRPGAFVDRGREIAAA
jgi:uncharacterized protein